MVAPNRKKPMTPEQRGIVHGYRSGFEGEIAKELETLGVSFEFETLRIPWVDRMDRKYKPDFILPNGIIVETKGRFVAGDRRKHLEVKKQHPHLDIRFVFYRASATLSTKSKTTYAMWCDKNGFKWADKHIPVEWLKEPKSKHSLVKYRQKGKT